MLKIKASSNSLIIGCFLLVITVLLFIPHGVSSRLLSANSPQESGLGENQNDDDDHSKTNKRGSVSGHDGSATGGDTPHSGVIPPSPKSPLQVVLPNNPDSGKQTGGTNNNSGGTQTVVYNGGN